MHKAFKEELDMLEDHYDDVIFRSRHKGLIEKVGTRLSEGTKK